jgi:hypothetical protein
MLFPAVFLHLFFAENHVDDTTICLNPHCDSGSTGSVMVFIGLFSKTFQRILPAMASREIPL